MLVPVSGFEIENELYNKLHAFGLGPGKEEFKLADLIKEILDWFFKNVYKKYDPGDLKSMGIIIRDIKENINIYCENKSDADEFIECFNRASGALELLDKLAECEI